VLVSVLGSMLVVSAFLMVSLGAVVQQAPAARRDQDSKAAIAAAEADVEEYLSRLNADTNYWKSGADPGNPAFGAAGRPIPGHDRRGLVQLPARVDPARDAAPRGGGGGDILRTLCVAPCGGAVRGRSSRVVAPCGGPVQTVEVR
jgi:hypothetical protein